MIIDSQTAQIGFWGGASVLFAFLISHAIADFALQGKFIAICKERGGNYTEFFGDSPPKLLWVHILTAHSLIHAGGVWLVSGSVVLGFAEFVLHWAIDYAKSGGLTTFHVDQFLHYGCKLGFVFILVWAPEIAFP